MPSRVICAIHRAGIQVHWFLARGKSPRGNIWHNRINEDSHVMGHGSEVNDMFWYFFGSSVVVRDRGEESHRIGWLPDRRYCIILYPFDKEKEHGILECPYFFGSPIGKKSFNMMHLESYRVFLFIMWSGQWQFWDLWCPLPSNLIWIKLLNIYKHKYTLCTYI